MYALTPDNAKKALRLLRRRAMSLLARPVTPAWLEKIARFDDPRAEPLARALDRGRRSTAAAADWVGRIEAKRAELRASREPLASHGTPNAGERHLSVGDATLASRRPADARFLYDLVYELAPDRVIELGTNVGISSAYMAAALETRGHGSLVTLDASVPRTNVARALHRSIGLARVDYVTGLFDATLESALGAEVDFAFIDGHHQLEPTLDYFDRIWRRSKEGAVFVFDDVRWTADMERAWAALKNDPRLRVVVDLCGLGIGIGTRDPRAAGRLVTPVLGV